MVNVEKRELGKDSSKYSLFLNDRNLLDRIAIKFLKENEGINLELSKEGVSLMVANKDTTDLFERLELFGIQESGDSIQLEKIDFQ